jgi:hypothetical protein
MTDPFFSLSPSNHGHLGCSHPSTNLENPQRNSARNSRLSAWAGGRKSVVKSARSASRKSYHPPIACLRFDSSKPLSRVMVIVSCQSSVEYSPGTVRWGEAQAGRESASPAPTRRSLVNCPSHVLPVPSRVTTSGSTTAVEPRILIPSVGLFALHTLGAPSFLVTPRLSQSPPHSTIPCLTATYIEYSRPRSLDLTYMDRSG